MNLLIYFNYGKSSSNSRKKMPNFYSNGRKQDSEWNKTNERFQNRKLGGNLPENRITIQFRINTDFVYTQLYVKTVLHQQIQFSISTQFNSI